MLACSAHIPQVTLHKLSTRAMLGKRVRLIDEAFPLASSIKRYLYFRCILTRKKPFTNPHIPFPASPPFPPLFSPIVMLSWFPNEHEQHDQNDDRFLRDFNFPSYDNSDGKTSATGNCSRNGPGATGLAHIHLATMSHDESQLIMNRYHGLYGAIAEPKRRS